MYVYVCVIFPAPLNQSTHPHQMGCDNLSQPRALFLPQLYAKGFCSRFVPLFIIATRPCCSCFVPVDKSKNDLIVAIFVPHLGTIF